MSSEASLPAARRPWPAAERGDMEAGLRRARRHSRLVRVLRVGLPGLVVLGSSAYLLAGWLDPLAMVPQLRNAGLHMSGSRITMDQPRVAGFMRNGRSYELSATAATQDLKEPQHVRLHHIRGRVQLKNGETVELRADLGSYDTRTETIALRENVVVAMSDGSRAEMAEAIVDARNGRVISDDTVQVVTGAGRLQARRMEVSEGGQLMTFRGGVTMDISVPASSGRRAP